MSGQPERMPESERERQPESGSSAWPGVVFCIVTLLTLATCYLGRIEALPWQ